jgi:hypothetical protein
MKIDLEEIEWEDMEWIRLDQDRDQVAGCCEHGKEFSCSKKKGGGFIEYVSNF